MKERFILRLVGLIVVLQDAMLTLNICHRAVVYDLSGIGTHFSNGCVWITVIAIVGVTFLFAPKWLLNILTGINSDNSSDNN